MILPSEVQKAAISKAKENYKFRRFLKNHADEKELDKQFLRLHNELFSSYDCKNCRNCCKLCSVEIPLCDFDKDAAYLGLSKTEFVDTYLKTDEHRISYTTKHIPCDFLKEDGDCLLGDCMPESCKNYPHTNQPDRLCSLLSFIENTAVCPVVYEICERLKKEYNFRYLG